MSRDNRASDEVNNIMVKDFEEGLARTATLQIDIDNPQYVFGRF